MFKKLNHWYDNIQEPYRFFFAMTVIGVWIIGIQVSKYNHPYIFYATLIYTIPLLAWTLSRMWAMR